MRRIKVIGGVAMLVLCGCGPTLSIQAGFQQSGGDIYLGRPTPIPSAVPVPAAINPYPNFPAPVELPPRFSTAPPPVLLDTCPTPAPTAYPLFPKIGVPRQPPAAATYPFRYLGAYVLTEPNGQLKGTPEPQTGTRQIENVTPPTSNGDYTFDVAETYNAMKQIDSYHIYPNGPVATGLGGEATPEAGIYLTQIVIENLDGTNAQRFMPAGVGVMLMPLPGQANQTFEGEGTDPISEKTWETDPNGGTVVGDFHVNACGNVVDAWQVTIAGHLVDARQGSGATTTFSLALAIATEYGGISVADHLIESGTDQATGLPFNYNVQATINVVPQGASS